MADLHRPVHSGRIADHSALGFLLSAVAVAGRALLGLPHEVTVADLSLSVLLLAGLFLLALARRQAALPLPALADVVLELYLCGQTAADTAPFWALARAADLALLIFCTHLVLCCAKPLFAAPSDGAPERAASFPRQARWVTLVLCLLWAVVSALLFYQTAFPQVLPAVRACSFAFLGFSLALVWFSVLALRAYRAARANH